MLRLFFLAEMQASKKGPRVICIYFAALFTSVKTQCVQSSTKTDRQYVIGNER